MTSFCRYGAASEVVLAEYLGKNRQEVEKWLHCDPMMFNWSSCIRYIVKNLEGGDELDIVKREERMRKIIKAVIPCDITQTPPIGCGYEGPYDMIASIFCIEAGSQTEEEYCAGVEKLVSLLKPGGYIQLFSGRWGRRDSNECGFYLVGDKRFHNVALSEDLVREALAKARCSHVTIKQLSVSFDPSLTDMNGFMFVTARN